MIQPLRLSPLSRTSTAIAAWLSLVVAGAQAQVTPPDVKPPDAKPSATSEAKSPNDGDLPSADTKVPTGPTAPQTASQTETFKKVLPSVALITVTEEGRGSHGTGWIFDVDRKLVITNHHVAGSVLKCVVFFPEEKDGRLAVSRQYYQDTATPYPGDVILSDPKRDLAVIRLQKLPQGAVALPLAKNDPSPAEEIGSIGNPADGRWVYTPGIVRQVHHERARLDANQVVDAEVVETQSPINPGDSGGPGFNRAGEVIGVVSNFASQARLRSSFIAVSEVHAFAKNIDELIDPQTVDQYVRRGSQFLERRFVVEALDDFEAALRQDSDASAALSGRGRCRMIMGKEDEAVADFNAALRNDPDNTEAREYRAAVGMQRELYEQAIEEIGEIIKRKPTDAFYYYMRGVAHGKNGDLASAVAQVNRALEMQPGNPMFLIGLGDIYFDARKPDEAAEKFIEVIRAGSPLKMQAFLKLGNTWLRLKRDNVKAANVFNEALKSDPRNAEAYLGRGDAFLRDGQYELALRDLMDALRLRPKYAEAFSLCGDVYLVSNAYKEAIAAYKSAVALDPARAIYHCDLGVALTRSEDFPGAIASLEQAAKLNPKMSRAYFYLAVAQFSSGREEDAQRAMDRAKKLDPKLAKAELKRRFTRNIGFANGTDKTIEVRVWYYTDAVDGKMGWHPTEPGMGTPMVHTIGPRETTYPALKGGKLPVAKLRFTYREKGGAFEVNRYRDVDLRITPEKGYIDASPQTFTYTLVEPKRE
jgi:tetratricopeptide (TPR) repeat protein